jgi:broad specificity phosphatase PhoE
MHRAGSYARPVLYLVRHGQTAHNALHEVHGLLDDPLDDEGRAQADALGVLFVGVPLTAVYASPLQRAVQTAEPIARAARLDVIANDRVLDRDYGPWTGHVKAEVIAQFGSIDAAPGVEPWTSFTQRVVTAVKELAEPHRDQRVVVVTHDAVNQAVLVGLFPGRWPDHAAITQRNGCWNRLDPAAPAGWTLAVFDAVPGDDQRP